MANDRPEPLGANDLRAEAYRRSSLRQWWLVIVVTVLTIVATIDRLVISLLADAIKFDLHLTDTQLSLIVSAGFAVANVLFTLPAGYLIDRVNRKSLIAFGAVVWSVMTMAGGFAGSFARLLATRAAVGFGESVIIPCSLSMIRSGLPEERRGRAFAIYSMQALVGTGIAMLTGGFLIHLAASGVFAGLPVLGALRAWEVVLVLLGALGLPLSLLLLTVREPPRLQHPVGEAGAASYRAALSHIRGGWKAYLPLLLYQITYSMTVLSFAAWLPPLLGRTWGLSMTQIGVSVGLMMVVLPPFGLFLAGWLIDRLSLRMGARGPCLMGAVLMTIAWAVSWSLPLMPTVQAMWSLLAFSFLVTTTPAAVTPTLMSRITPDRLMGKVTGIQYFLTGLLSAAIGPVVVALISDNLFSGPRALAYALSSVVFVYGLVAVASILACARTIPAYERGRS